MLFTMARLADIFFTRTTKYMDVSNLNDVIKREKTMLNKSAIILLRII